MRSIPPYSLGFLTYDIIEVNSQTDTPEDLLKAHEKVTKTPTTFFVTVVYTG
jgi:hypothetical protein